MNSVETADDSTDQPPSSRSVLQVELPIQLSQPPVAKLDLDKKSPLNRFERIRQPVSELVTQSVNQTLRQTLKQVGSQQGNKTDNQTGA